ncbi:MAG TPA: TlpA disulfide reductase family protein, partial [Chloroflexota bacterium]|nr:TlpA disulfide reductase family protein [Chloroflexota bacterium]
MASSPPQASSSIPTPDDPELAPAVQPSAELPPTIRRLRAARALLWAMVGVMTVIWLFFGGGLESITSMVRPAPAPVSTADIGQVAPPLRLPLVGGGEMDLGGFRGRVILLNFWATWCEPCKAEMPVFERAQQQYRDRGLVVLGVDFQERDEEITAFLSQVGVTFPSLVDRTGEVTRQWRATGLPTTFLIDRQGIIRDVRVGAFTETMLEERLAKLM